MSEKKERNRAFSYNSLAEEYRKIYWPGKVEVFHITVIVLLVTLFVAVYVLTFDAVFSIVLRNLTNILKPLLGGM